jgi:hypothetical protein
MSIRFINSKHLISSVLLTLLTACSGGSGSSDSSSDNTDRSPGLVDSGINVTEGDSGSNIITLSYTADTTQTVNYQTYDIDAVAKSDFKPLEGSMSMEAGQTYTFEIEIYSDQRIEGDEKVGLLISDEAGAEISRLSGTILNDDFPEITLAAADATEGDLGTNKLLYYIRLSENTVDPLVLDVRTSDREESHYGLAGTDYTAFAETITFTAEELEKVITISVNGDTDIEPNESVELVVTHLEFPSQTIAAVIKTDDVVGVDVPKLIVNSGSALEIPEGPDSDDAASLIQTVRFSYDTEFGDFTPFVVNASLVEYSSDNENDTTTKATLGEDFETQVVSFEITPSQNEYEYSFSITDDENIEEKEVLKVSVENDAGVRFDETNVFIVDNDSPEYEIYTRGDEINAVSTEVPGGQLELIENTHEDNDLFVRLANGRTYPYDIEIKMLYHFPTGGGNDADYPADADDLSEGNGATNTIKQITLRALAGESILKVVSGSETKDAESLLVKNDSIVEADETLYVQLQNNIGSNIGEKVELIIKNDDQVYPYFSSASESVNEATQQDVTVQWNEEIADNVLPLTLNVIGSCVTDGCTLGQDVDLNDSVNVTINADNVASKETTVGISISNDGVVEPDEVLTLVLQVPDESSYFMGLGDQATHFYTIVNDDFIYPYFTSPAYTGLESVTEATVNLAWDQVVASNVPKIALNIEASCEAEGCNLSGQAGADLTLSSDVSFAEDNLFVLHSGNGVDATSANVAGKTIGLTVINDEWVEPDEVLAMTLSAATSDLDTEAGNSFTYLRFDDASKNTATTYTVDNNDFIVPRFSAAITEISEGTPVVDLDSSNTTVVDLNVVWDQPLATNLSEQSITLNLPDESNQYASAADGDINLASSVDRSIVAGSSSFDVGLIVNTDDLVEPNEIVKVEFSTSNLGSEIRLDGDLSGSVTLTINNDDVINPVVEFLSAETTEPDVDDSEVGYRVSWNKDVADNVDDLTIGIDVSCRVDSETDCASIEQADFIIDDSDIAPPSDSRLVERTFNIAANGMVEPDEIVTISLNLNDVPSHYLADEMSQTQAQFTIIDNDELVISYPASSTNSVSGYHEITVSENDPGDDDASRWNDTGFSIQWDKTIASNVETLAFQVSRNSSCGQSQAYYCIVAADIELPENGIVQIHEKNTATAAGVKSLDLAVYADNVVEPTEYGLFTLALQGSDLNTYLNSDWVDETLSLQINNDDYVNPYIVALSSSTSAAPSQEDEGESDSATVAVDMGVFWQEEIADNVPALSVNLSASCPQQTFDNLANLEGCTVPDGLPDTAYDFTIADSVSIASGSITDPQTVALYIVKDSVVEPNETINISISAPSTLRDYFLNPSADGTVDSTTYTILNDDKIKPYISTGDTNAEGVVLQDYTENNASAGGASGVQVSWDAAEIADNVRSDLSFNVEVVVCTDNVNCAEAVDLVTGPGNLAINVFSDAVTRATNKNSDIGLLVKGETLVEPDEILDLQLKVVSDEYFEEISTRQVAELTIKNDDKTVLTLLKGETSAVAEAISDDNPAEGPEDTANASKYFLNSSLILASNLPSITLTAQTQPCTEDNDLTNGVACAGSGDYSIKDLVLSSAGLDAQQNIALSGFEVTGDDSDAENRLVELTELVDERFVTTSEYVSSETQSISLEHKIQNDDVLNVSITGSDNKLYDASGSGVNEDQPGPILKVFGDKRVAANVPAINVTLSVVDDGSGYTQTAENSTQESDFSYEYTLEADGSNKAAIPTSGLPLKSSAQEYIANTPLYLHLNIEDDSIVENFEVIAQQIYVADSLSNYAVVTSESTHEFAHGIRNNDFLAPEYTVTGPVTLNEDELADGEDYSALDLQVTWAKQIAPDVEDLDLIISRECVSSSCGEDDDFTDTSPTTIEIHRYNDGTANTQAASDKGLLALRLEPDTTVEPDETYSIKVRTPDDESVASYFSADKDTQVDSINVVIGNDDLTTLEFYKDDSKLVGDYTVVPVKENTTIPEYTLRSSLPVAANVGDISITVSRDDCSGLDVSTGCATADDISITSTFVINPKVEESDGEGGTVEVRYPLLTTQDIDLRFSVVSDTDYVELDELVNLKVTSSSEYVSTPTDGDNQYLVGYLEHKIENDDKVEIEFHEASQNVDEDELVANYSFTFKHEQKIAQNVPAINVAVGINCTTDSETYCHESDFTIADNKMTIPIHDGASETLALTDGEVELDVVNDDVIEPDTQLTISLTPGGDGSAYAATDAITSDVTILNDDTVTLTLSTASKNEGNSILMGAWPGFKYRGYTGLSFEVDIYEFDSNTTLTQDDYSFDGICSRESSSEIGSGNLDDKLTCTFSSNTPDSDGIYTVATNEGEAVSLITSENDNKVEADDELVMVASSLLSDRLIYTQPDVAEESGLPAGRMTAEIINDDVYSISLAQGADGAEVELGDSALLFEGEAGQNIKLKICAPETSLEGVAGGSEGTPALTAKLYGISSGDGVSQAALSDVSLVIGTATPDDNEFAQRVLELSEVEGTALARCQYVEVITDVAADASLEESLEGLRIVIDNHVRCSSGLQGDPASRSTVCFGGNNSADTGTDSLTDNQGIVIIKDATTSPISDSGNNKCIYQNSGAVAALSNVQTDCQGTQDNQVDYRALSFLKLNSNGNPIVDGSSYECVLDGTTGYTWFVANDETGASINNDVALGDVTSSAGIEKCGITGDFVVPGVKELMAVMNYGQTDNMAKATSSIVNTDKKYWASEFCTGSGRWAFDYNLGAPICLDDSVSQAVNLVHKP